MRFSFKQLVMGAQLIAAISAGGLAVFKGKEALHEYLTQNVPVLAIHGDIQQSLSGDGLSILLTVPVIKTRQCRLIDAGGLTATLYQTALTLTQFLYLKPVIRLRPQEYVQAKQFGFDIPKSYKTGEDGLLVLDLQFSCKKRNESVYLDIPVRSLTDSEQSQILIMRQASEMNEKGQWRKGQ